MARALIKCQRNGGEGHGYGVTDSAIVMSSTMPSVNYSCSGPRDMFWSGSTAIDDLSRSGKGISGDGAAEALATHSVAASGAVISQSPAARVLPARRRPSA